MFSADALRIDPAGVVHEIAEAVREIVRGGLKKKGAVVAMSGGVDSSVVAALCTKALGPGNVLGLFLPERDSTPAGLERAQKLAAQLGIQALREDITPILDALGCYRRRDTAIRSVFPDYREGYKQKIILQPDFLERNALNVFYLVVESPKGEQQKKRLPVGAYLEIVAATNMKQRTRKLLEYYHADRLNYAVSGTPNRLEYDQGFFVKLGDGAADLKPIAHLYKTQVYELARFLGLPDEICTARPTTDTYSLEQTQEEFYFKLPYDRMDLALYAHNHGIPSQEAAPVLGLTAEQLERICRDIEQKRSTTRYLHLPPQLVREVEEVKVEGKTGDR
ncbi:MAG: NAD(+) synthase [bacterium]